MKPNLPIQLGIFYFTNTVLSVAILRLLAFCFFADAANDFGKLKITVAILTESFDDFKLKELTALNVFDEFVSGNYSYASPSLLEPVIVPVYAANGTNPLEISEGQVCEEIICDSFAVILVHPEEETDFPVTVGFALSFFQVPVISTSSRVAKFSDKSIYPSFLRTVPSWSNQADVWIDLLITLHYHQVILIYTKEQDSDLFINRFRTNAEVNNIDIQLTFSLESEMSEEPDFSEVSEVTSNIYLMHAKNPNDCAIIFDAASKINMTGLGKAWILSEETLKSSKIPEGALGIRLDQTKEESLFDAFRTLQSVSSRFIKAATLKKVPSHAPVNCSYLKFAKSRKNIEMWKELYFNLTNVHELLPDRQSILSFSRDGDRLGSNYEIVNAQNIGDHYNKNFPSLVTIGQWFYKNKPVLNPMESFMQPFKLSLWTCLFASVVIIGISLFTLDKLSPFSRFYNLLPPETTDKNPLRDSGSLDEETPLSFSGSMWFVWGVLLDSGIGEKTPRSFSARMLGMVWCGFSTIMVASYTANLAAFLVLDQPTRSLRGITDTRLRNPSANFTFATVEGSATYMYFKRHVELSTMFRKMEGKNYANSFDGIQAVKNGSLDAFIWDSTRLEFEAERDCSLVTSGDVFGNSAYGVGLQKNSPWTRLVTLAILELLEAGKMDLLDSEWISSGEDKDCKVVDSDDSSPAARLGLTNMRDVFFLLAGGVTAGCILIFFEVVYKRHQLRRIRRRRLAMGYGRLWRRLTAERQNQRSLGHHALKSACAQFPACGESSDGMSLASSGLIFCSESIDPSRYAPTRPELVHSRSKSLAAPSTIRKELSDSGKTEQSFKNSAGPPPLGIFHKLRNGNASDLDNSLRS